MYKVSPLTKKLTNQISTVRKHQDKREGGFNGKHLPLVSF